MQRIASATSNLFTRKNIAEQCFQSIVPDYALVFFDHLHSEYLAVKPKMKDERVIMLFESLSEKRASCKLTWSDIYTFDLALVDERPLENLVRKAYDARSKYRSIAGQKEYDEYLASKPPDLTAILIGPGVLKLDSEQPEEPITSPPTPPPLNLSPPESPPLEPTLPQSAEIVQRVLRADIRYLLSKFYLYYAMLPMREDVRERLTRRAVRITIAILMVILVLAIISLGGLSFLTKLTTSQLFDITGIFGITVGSVVFAGIIGGCVSMLQRIQSAPTEGDALFNLASLTNGWVGLSLSPLYGGIFAAVLFFLFAAGVLRGAVFPTIETADSDVASTERVETPIPSPSPTATASPQATIEAAAAALASPTTPTASPSPSATASPSRSPSPKNLTETQRTGILHAKDFIKQTGPNNGVSFALLMIWSFIAGFAERLVPDTLNRLVAKTEAIQGTNT